jgi:hypothetical protein|nr:MAG TPA: KELCH-LIKE PROTEIN 2, SERINE/THREONINE-PROTEIN KINASE PROTEIN-TRANSFERASE COMPLEX, KLHL3, UBIQUITIN [Caudoviricetes sp.]
MSVLVNVSSGRGGSSEVLDNRLNPLIGGYYVAVDNSIVSSGSGVSYKGVQYMIDTSGNAFKYDTVGRTYTSLGTKTNGGNQCLAVIGDYLYIVSGLSGVIIRRCNVSDISTNFNLQVVSSTIPTPSQEFDYSVVGGSSIYMVCKISGNTHGVYKVDINQNKLIHIVNVPFQSSRILSSTYVFDNNIYIVGCAPSRGFCKFDVITNTISSLQNQIVDTSNPQILYNDPSCEKVNLLGATNSQTYDVKLDKWAHKSLNLNLPNNPPCVYEPTEKTYHVSSSGDYHYVIKVF